MNNIQNTYENLLRGKPFPMPGGKVARPTSKPRTCPTCSGSKTIVEEMPAACKWAYEESPCSACWGTGKIVDFVIEDDPMVLTPWAGAEHRCSKGVATRKTLTGERVAEVRNNRGTISTSIVTGDESFTIALTITAPGGADEARLWATAMRLADAELVHLGYRRA